MHILRKKCIFTVMILAAALAFSACKSADRKSGRVPPAPGAPAVEPGNGRLYLSWKAVKGAKFYEVWYGAENDHASSVRHNGMIEATEYTLTGLTNGRLYFVWLKAGNPAGTSRFCEAASGTPEAPLSVPPAPGGLTVKPGKDFLSLSWNAAEGAASYEVWYGLKDDPSSAARHGETTETNYTMTGLAAGTAYYVWIKAKNRAGASGFGKGAGAAAGYSMGSAGPAGGIVFYDKGSYSTDGNGSWRYLEAAPTDLVVERVTEISWSSITNVFIGTTGTAIGTGKANTAAIIGQGASSGAAYACIHYRGGGCSDWFLPSKDELNCVYANLVAGGVGGFTANYYWTSSEYDAFSAWVQYFGNQVQYRDKKNIPRSVRAVRAF